MKKAILFPLFFLGLHALHAQQDIKLPGLVVEQNSQYRTGTVKYLSNAEIKSAGATPQRSDDKGQFTLVFADRPGGDVARIFAAKSGYEVVNEEELKQASVIGRLKPLKIVMCEQGKLYDNQMAYYNIARDASLDAYKRKVAALQQDGKEQQRLIAELRVQFNQDIKTKDEAIALLDKQRQNVEKQAKELADKFVTENLDDQSPAYQRAFAAFEAKNIELAKAILDSVDLEKRLALNSSAKAKEQALVDTLQKNIAKRAEEIRQDVNICLFKARLHKLDFEWADAERFYDLAIAYNSSNYEVAFEVAHYMQSQNQFAKARNYYEKALTLTSQPYEKSSILNNLGNLLYDYNEMSGAKKAYEEALQIGRKLAKKNRDVYLPDVAMILNNLGTLLQANNEIGGAKKAYEEALQIRKKLPEKNRDVYLPDVAMTLNNLGTLLKANNEMDGAKKAYEEALQIRRKLAEKNPVVYLSGVANTLNNLGVLLSDNNEMDGAKKAYEEALQIRRQLAEKNSDVYLPDVAETLTDLGNLLQANNGMDGAKKAYEEALQIRKKLAEKNRDVYLPDVAITLNNLGTLLEANNEMDGAKKAYEEALQIRRQLAEKNPRVYNLVVAMTDINIGLFYEQLLKSTRDMSLKAVGLELMQDAEKHLELFPETHPKVQQYRADIHRITQFFKDFDESVFQFLQQIERLSALVKANETEKDPHQKVQRQQEIISILSEIEKVMPGNKELANLMTKKYGSLAWYQLFVQQFAEAEQSARMGLTKDPNEEWINTNLALALLYQSKWEAAKQIYESLKDKPYGDSTYRATFLEDLAALEKEGITHPDVAKARKLLENK